MNKLEIAEQLNNKVVSGEISLSELREVMIATGTKNGVGYRKNVLAAHNIRDKEFKKFASVTSKEQAEEYLSAVLKYIAPKSDIELARKKWEALEKYRAEMMPTLILATEKEIINLLGFDPTKGVAV